MVGATKETFKKPKDLSLGCVQCEIQTNGSEKGRARAGQVCIWALLAPNMAQRSIWLELRKNPSKNLKIYHWAVFGAKFRPIGPKKAEQ